MSRIEAFRARQLEQWTALEAEMARHKQSRAERAAKRPPRAPKPPDMTVPTLAALAEEVRGLKEAFLSPRRVIEDENGKPVGVEIVVSNE